MRQSYEKTKWMPVKLRGFVDLVRPFTLIAPFLGCIIAVLAATGATGAAIPWMEVKAEGCLGGGSPWKFPSGPRARRREFEWPRSSNSEGSVR